MAVKVRIWFDAEANFLEVRFSDTPGYEAGNPARRRNGAGLTRKGTSSASASWALASSRKTNRSKPISSRVEIGPVQGLSWKAESCKLPGTFTLPARRKRFSPNVECPGSPGFRAKSFHACAGPQTACDWRRSWCCLPHDITRSAHRRNDFGAQWLAYVCPRQRFTRHVTMAGA